MVDLINPFLWAFDTSNERSTEHPTEPFTERSTERDYLYISITYGIVNEHPTERSTEHPTERYLTNFTTSSRTYLLRPAIPNPSDLSNSIKYHL